MCSCSCCENSKYFEPFEEIMQSWGGSESELIPILQKLQGAYGYLPEDIIARLSERTGIFVSNIMGVATFYSQFKLQPAGEHTIKLCFGTACHVNGAETVADVYKRQQRDCVEPVRPPNPLCRLSTFPQW